MIRGTPGLFGTGIWPYRISRMVGGFAMLVKIGKEVGPRLSRDYLSILYLPIIPLGLSALVDSGRQRITLNRENKSILVEASKSVRGSRLSDRERRLAGVRKSWILAFLVAAGGAFLGYLVTGYFLQSWQPGMGAILGGLLGCCLVNRLFLAAIS